MFSVTLDPATYREVKRGLLPVGMEVRARPTGGEAVTLEHVGTAALRTALRA